MINRPNWWKDPSSLEGVNLEAELDRHPDLANHIPRNNSGKPKALSAKTLPVGVAKGDTRRVELWKETVSKYRKVYGKGRSLEKKWLLALLIYKNLCHLKKISPFGESGDQMDAALRAYLPMLVKKLEVALGVPDRYGWQREGVKLSRVDVLKECPNYSFGVPCLLVSFSYPKNKYEPKVDALRELSDRELEEFGFDGYRAWECAPESSWSVYLVEKPRQWLLTLVSPLPTTLKGHEKAVKSTARTWLSENLKTRR